jgi:type III secretory pathway component EscV
MSKNQCLNYKEDQLIFVQRLSVLKCLFLSLVVCKIVLPKPNIFVDVLIGLNTELYILFYLETD